MLLQRCQTTRVMTKEAQNQILFKALAHYKDFHKDFSEKIVAKIVVHI